MGAVRQFNAAYWRGLVDIEEGVKAFGTTREALL